MKENLIDLLIGIIPAVVGGIARYVHDITRSAGEFDLKTLLLQIFIAAFVGWLTMSIVVDIEYFIQRPSLQGAVVGISSFLSPNILLLIEDVFPKVVNKFLKKKGL